MRDMNTQLTTEINRFHFLTSRENVLYCFLFLPTIRAKRVHGGHFLCNPSHEHLVQIILDANSRTSVLTFKEHKNKKIEKMEKLKKMNKMTP